MSKSGNNFLQVGNICPETADEPGDQYIFLQLNLTGADIFMVDYNCKNPSYRLNWEMTTTNSVVVRLFLNIFIVKLCKPEEVMKKIFCLNSLSANELVKGRLRPFFINKNNRKEKQMRRLNFFHVMIFSLSAIALTIGIGLNTGQAAPVLQVGSNGYYIPDYYTTPNWANSPPLTKFMDDLAPLGCGSPTATLGQCIPVAAAQTLGTLTNDDYYELALVEYREQMHSQLPATGTKLRGYVQVVSCGAPGAVPLTTANGLTTNITDAASAQVCGATKPHYLGPIIVATKDRPVRIKFTNYIPANSSLFLPLDTTIMGSGDYSINYNPVTKVITGGTTSGTFSQNRATLHLHGGRTPWISDGTAHQWITPRTESQSYGKGVSVSYVPDMWFSSVSPYAAIPGCAGQTTCGTANATNNPGPGSQTFYYTNQQSSRLLFYHDHAWGITRLNVYAGEAAGYVIRDAVEQALISGGTVGGRTFLANTIPGAVAGEEIPLIIQDKTFVNATLGGDATVYTMATDPTWAWGSNPAQPVTASPVTGDLWWPHVYMPAQNPYNPDLSGINAMGRWHYGPWFFPSTPTCGSSAQAIPPFCVTTGPAANPYSNGGDQPPEIPGTPNPSWGAEAFLDTMMVNGTVYPKLSVEAKPYRFRILNASHDRFLNLQLYRATSIVNPATFTLTNPGAGCTEDPVVTITSGAGRGATATATVDTGTGTVTSLSLDTVGSGYTDPITVTFTGGGCSTPPAATATAYTSLTEVGMVPAVPTSGFPAKWPKDGREGGVPDPATAGPTFIQIGTEGGFLPKPAVLPNQPIQWNVDPTMFNVGNVLQQRDGGGTLILGPAERADVIVDFTAFPNSTLILYNDAPTAFPALDPHYDYYTGSPDRRDIGGYKAIGPGAGPNVRTVMQINVNGTVGTAFNMSRLNAAFAPAAGVLGVFPKSQDPIVVGQTAYNSTYNTTYPATWPNWGLSRISDGAISFRLVDNTTTMSNFVMRPKAIHDEMGATFDDFGRMSAKLGLEMPFTNAAIANFILQNFVDPATELVNPNQIQIWRITHNGVDTHPIHFHLFDVQVLNRVGWDGFIRLPDDNELGWKDTVRMAPLEDTIVALRPVAPRVPFALPHSIRPLNPQTAIGTDMGFSQIDPADGGPLNPPQTNQMVNFGHEYVWHCHILSHEENDMMRPMIMRPFVSDFNRDNKVDIVWRNKSTGANRIWFMNNTAYSSTTALQSSTNTNWELVGTADFNSDGNSDLLWRNKATGQNAVWLMNGSTVLSTPMLANRSDLNWKIVATADFNNDGYPDIVWRNSSTGENSIWLMRGTTFLSDVPFNSAPNVNWQLAGTGDFNHDGKVDLLWRHRTTGQNAVWLMNGTAVSSVVMLQASTNLSWKMVGAADLNGDGFIDILWRNTSTGANAVWLMRGTTFVSSVGLQAEADQNWELVAPR
jgi:FtsP/CotA-like multicopper oxidase with cupredoxin domain